MINWNCLLKAIVATLGVLTIGVVVMASLLCAFALGRKHPILMWGILIGLLFSGAVGLEYLVCIGY